MKRSWRRVAIVVAGCMLSALALTPAALAQPYPNRAIRLVVPFPPGGTTDILARDVAKQLTETLGQSVVVDNRPGAGGNIGADLVAKSAPDGYTLLMGTVGTHAINPSLYTKMPYDHLKDFAPVVLVAGVPNVLVVNPSLPVNSVADLIKLAKAKPGNDQFRIERQRHVDPPVRRAVQDHGRRRHDARAVQRQFPRAHRFDQRPGAGHVRQPAFVAAADQGGQAPRDRGDIASARARVTRRSYHRRVRPAGFRGQSRGSACSRPWGRLRQ